MAADIKVKMEPRREPRFLWREREVQVLLLLLLRVVVKMVIMVVPGNLDYDSDYAEVRSSPMSPAEAAKMHGTQCPEGPWSWGIVRFHHGRWPTQLKGLSKRGFWSVELSDSYWLQKAWKHGGKDKLLNLDLQQLPCEIFVQVSGTLDYSKYPLAWKLFHAMHFTYLSDDLMFVLCCFFLVLLSLVKDVWIRPCSQLLPDCHW